MFYSPANWETFSWVYGQLFPVIGERETEKQSTGAGLIKRGASSHGILCRGLVLYELVQLGIIVIYVISA